MFRASSCPSSRATTTAVAASGLPSELGDSSAVGRSRAGSAYQHKSGIFPAITPPVCGEREGLMLDVGLVSPCHACFFLLLTGGA